MHGSRPHPPRTRRQRFTAWATVCVLLGIASTAVGVMVFGTRSPSPPSLVNDPRTEIPGQILFRDESQCVAYAPASGGEPIKAFCRDTSPSPITWIDGQTVGIVRETEDGELEMNLVDLPTGEDRGVQEPPESLVQVREREQVSVLGERARVDASGRLFIASESGVEKEVANFATADNRLSPVIWSPDGEWLLLYYAPPRDFARNEFWIVRRNGKDAGLFYRGTAEPYASWRIEGVGITPE